MSKYRQHLSVISKNIDKIQQIFAFFVNSNENIPNTYLPKHFIIYIAQLMLQEKIMRNRLEYSIRICIYYPTLFGLFTIRCDAIANRQRTRISIQAKSATLKRISPQMPLGYDINLKPKQVVNC